MATFVDLYATQLDYELGSNDSAVLFTTARRKHAVNEGLREFADLTECWTKESTIACSNGVGVYNLLSSVNIPGEDFVRVAAQGPVYRYIDPTSSANNTTWLGGEDFPRRDIPWLDAHQPGWRASTGTTYPESGYLDDQAGALNFGVQPPPTIVSSASGALLVP